MAGRSPMAAKGDREQLYLSSSGRSKAERAAGDGTGGGGNSDSFDGRTDCSPCTVGDASYRYRAGPGQCATLPAPEYDALQRERQGEIRDKRAEHLQRWRRPVWQGVGGGLLNRCCWTLGAPAPCATLLDSRRLTGFQGPRRPDWPCSLSQYRPSQARKYSSAERRSAQHSPPRRHWRPGPFQHPQKSLSQCSSAPVRQCRPVDPPSSCSEQESL